MTKTLMGSIKGRVGDVLVLFLETYSKYLHVYFGFVGIWRQGF